MNWTLIYNSLLVSGAATAAAVAGGALAALFYAGLSGIGKKIFLMASIMALVLPPFMAANCWISLLGETGTWRRWLPFNIYTPLGTVWILLLLNWPISFLFTAAAWQRIQTAHLETDPLLRGAALVRWLLLPLARPALLRASVLTFVMALNNFAVPAILQVKVFPAEVWVLFNTTFDYRAAILLSWPLIFAPLILVLCFRGRGAAWSWQSSQATPRAFRQQLGGTWHWMGGVSGLILAGFSLGVPLWQLAASRHTWTEFLPALAAGHAAIAHSLGYAVLTAFVIVLFGLATWRLPLDTILWLPFFMPGVLVGIALIWIFNRRGLSGIYQSAAIVIIAYALRYTALGWNTVARALRATDPSLTAMARLEGANVWQTFRHIQWPQISPQISAAWYVTYLLCLWDVETLVLIVPPGGESLSLRVFNLLHYGHNTQVNALCLLLMALALLPLAAGALLKFLRVPLLLTVAALFALAGCSADSSNTAPVQSKFFSKVQVFGTRGAGFGEINKPRSVAVDAQDNLYVVDMTGRVQKFSPNGVCLSFWQMPEVVKGKPKGMARDKDGNIIVVEPHYSRVNYYSPEGKFLSQFGVHGTNGGQLGMPRAAVVDAQDDIYVCEYTLSERVQEFSKRGAKFIRAFGKLGDGPGEFSRAEGLGIDAGGNIYVADSCNHRIQIFSGDGKFLRMYGKAGSGAGELSYPYDIQIDRTGLQFVCEFGNSRIQIFDQNDKPVEILGGPGGDPGQFSNPWGIAFDSKGNLFVADAVNNRVQKFWRK